MKNQVIEVLNKEHGKRVIEYWKSRGVETFDFEGINTREDGNCTIYYGIINGHFSCYSERELKEECAEIITLPEENKYPKLMWVWDNSETCKVKRVVFAQKNDKYLAWINAETLEDAEKTVGVYSWRNAEDIQCSEEIKEKVRELSDKEILSRGLNILAAYVKSLEYDCCFTGITLYHNMSGKVETVIGEKVFEFDDKESLMSRICKTLDIYE